MEIQSKNNEFLCEQCLVVVEENHSFRFPSRFLNHDTGSEDNFCIQCGEEIIEPFLPLHFLNETQDDANTRL